MFPITYSFLPLLSIGVIIAICVAGIFLALLGVILYQVKRLNDSGKGSGVNASSESQVAVQFLFTYMSNLRGEMAENDRRPSEAECQILKDQLAIVRSGDVTTVIKNALESAVSKLCPD